MLKKLGVIGGMGPEATSFYYARVIARTKAESDQEHINMIILSHATMPDRTQAILTGNKLPFLKAITQDARDLEMLQGYGYRVERACCVDMFPWSANVETVVLLSRETNPLTVEVRMEVETGEVKEHPTYKRIQEYVQEKYGFKVHTAYIAEVKRMVGLDMHKAPNAVEQRKHEYHPCPPEKVEAIKDALRHFGLTSE